MFHRSFTGHLSIPKDPWDDWRIIPLSKWLGSPPFISHGMAICKGNVAVLRGLTITMVINHLLTGMILQVWYIYLHESLIFMVGLFCRSSHGSYGNGFLLGLAGIKPTKSKPQLEVRNQQLSNEKNLGWLGYIGDYTTQLYRDYNKPL